MSWQRVPEGLCGEDHDFMKLYKIMVTEVHRVLLFLFSTACPKHKAQNLEDYLRGPGMGMSWKMFSSFFNYRQREILKKDPTGKEFDITLLAAAIPVSCLNLTKDMEGHMNSLRIFRNDLLHKYPIIDLNAMEKVMRDLVKKTYLSIGTRYPIDVSSNIRQMEDNIDNILKATVPVPDSIKYQHDLKVFRDELKADFRIKGQEELKTNPKFQTTTDPASFIPGRESTLMVTVIYTRIDIVVQELHVDKPNYSIEYENLFRVLNQKGKIPSMIILEGPPGAGKTTLSKYLHAQWENCLQGGHCSIIDIDKFDLVFPFECSNTNVTSYVELITYHLPNTTLYLRNEDILRSAKQLKILILIDAADDLNSKSKTLLRELVETRVPESGGNLRILCTTRPQALKELLSVIQKSKISKVRTKITGIPPNRRGEFVRRLHDEMISEGQSTQDTEGLVDYLKHSHDRLGDHFKFPLTLSLLTYLWAFDPGAVNGVTTISKLYLAIHKLINIKLSDRLRNHKMLRSKCLSDIKLSCCKFLETLYQESLVSISLDVIIWPDRCINNLKSAAVKHSLPLTEVSSSFLSHTCKWTPYGYSDQFAGCHKSLTEFFSAFYITDVITGIIKTNHQLDLENKLANEGLSQSDKMMIEEELLESKTVYGVLKNNPKDKLSSLEMSKYQNILVHLLGLLNNRGKVLLYQFHEEVVKLMESCRHGLDWFQVVSEVECDSIVTRCIAEKLTEKEKEVWLINESTNMKAAIEMIKTVSPKKVNIKLVTDSSTHSDLLDLIEKLSKTTCIVEIEDKWSFRNPDKSSTNAYLSIISRCLVKMILTSVRTITDLPKEVVDLNLGLLEDPVSREVQDPGLTNLGYFSQLESFAVNVKAGAGTGKLSRLPVLLKRAGLFLSEMREDHIGWAIDTMKVLQPGPYDRLRGGYAYLALPNCYLNIDNLCELIQKLSESKVNIGKNGYLWVQSRNKNTNEEWKKLRQTTERILHCSLYWEETDQYL